MAATVSGLRPEVQLERTIDRSTGGSLIGRLEVIKELNRTTVVSMVQKGWQLKGSVEVTDITRNIFVFQFSDSSDYMKVLKGRPWSIQSHLLNLQEWEDDMVMDDVCFAFVPMWLQVHGLPFGFLNRVNACRIGSLVGDVLLIEDPRKHGLVARKFLRIRVLLDIHRPLVDGFWIPREGRQEIWAGLCYERLPSHCFKYGRIGHEQRMCSKEGAAVEADSTFGIQLRAQTPRPMLELLCLIKKGWCEWDQQQSTGVDEVCLPQAGREVTICQMSTLVAGAVPRCIQDGKEKQGHGSRSLRGSGIPVTRVMHSLHSVINRETKCLGLPSTGSVANGPPVDVEEDLKIQGGRPTGEELGQVKIRQDGGRT